MTVLEFHKERLVFSQEYHNGMYGILPYYFSKLAFELPLLFIIPFLHNSMTFWTIGYNEDAFLKFLLVTFLMAQVGNSLGYFLSCLNDNMLAAIIKTENINMPSYLLAGYLTNFRTFDQV